MEYSHKMASSINPYNINGNYPVAGQDNDSQGFRDNFTNTRNNLVFAKSELEDLQSKVLLKSPLLGGSASDPNFNQMSGTRLSGVQLKSWYETHDRKNPAGSNVSLNFDTANFYSIVTNGPVTLTPAGFPTGSAAGWGKIMLLIEVTDVAHTVSFPNDKLPTGIANVKGFNGINRIDFAAVGSYFFEIGSHNGNAFYIIDLSRNYTETTVEEEIANGSAIDLTLTAAYFVTGGAETATLALGSTGQIIVLAAHDVTAGNMVITVSAAGWKASGTGTITFDARGEACTLQCINSKWFCVGNNGATFA